MNKRLSILFLFVFCVSVAFTATGDDDKNKSKKANKENTVKPENKSTKSGSASGKKEISDAETDRLKAKSGYEKTKTQPK